MNIKHKLKIGVLNLMPQAETYMPVLSYYLEKQAELVWIRLREHSYKSSDRNILDKTHVYFDEKLAASLDGMILTGAPVDRHDYLAVRYWDELNKILQFTYANVYSMLGLCWGAMALGKIFFDIEKNVLEKKLYGIYKMQNTTSHELNYFLDDEFWCPQSRYAAMDNDQLIGLASRGKLVMLDFSPEVGYCSIATPDGKLVMHQGHFEYPTDRLAQEYHRDLSMPNGGNGIPVNYLITNPKNLWRANGQAFFSAWIALIYSKRSNPYEKSALCH